MIIKPILGELEIPGLQRIGADQRRRIVDVPIPGLEGNLSQDLGSESIRIIIEGSLAKDEARDGFLESAREMYDTAEPVDFVGDIITATEVFQVLVEELNVKETAGSSSPFTYQIALRQYVPPPEPSNDLGFGDGFPGVDELGLDLDLGLELDAGNLFDLLEIPDLLAIPNFGDPTQPLSSAMDTVSSSMDELSSLSSSITTLFGGGD